MTVSNKLLAYKTLNRMQLCSFVRSNLHRTKKPVVALTFKRFFE